MKKFQGTGVALVTPFNPDLEVDYKGIKSLLDFTSNAVDYFVVQGTTGESTTTTSKEKFKILDFVLNNNEKQLPIVYGIGGNNTNAVVEEINQTNLSGVDAILSVSPYYNKPTQEGIFQHYYKIAENSPVPVILYNVPGRTMSNITAVTTIRLAQHPNIIGIKEASGDLEQCRQIISDKPDNFMLISGDDLLTTSMMSIGAVGVISVLANAFPSTFKALTQAALKGDFESSRKITERLQPINTLMYSESNPVGIKEVLRQKNICHNNVRLPLLTASEQLTKEIASVLNQLA